MTFPIDDAYMHVYLSHRRPLLEALDRWFAATPARPDKGPKRRTKPAGGAPAANKAKPTRKSDAPAAEVPAGWVVGPYGDLMSQADFDRLVEKELGG